MSNTKYEFIDLFAGIGGTRIAFENAGAECVFSSEIDESAKETYEHNFSETPRGDIKEINADSIPDHDILVAGFPCPSFSIIGKMEGLEDKKGELFFEIERILTEKQPHSFLLENVKNLKSIGNGKVLQRILGRLREAGYYVNWKVLNALDYGLPQKRERIILVGFQENYRFSFPEPIHERKSLEEILEDSPDDEYEATDYIKEKREDAVNKEDVFEPSIWHENKSGNVSILPYSPALRAKASYNYILINGRRHPTTREMLRLQGFPEDFDICGTSRTSIRKQIGNSVPVPMIEAVAENLIKALNRGEVIPNTEQLELFDLSENA